MKVYDVDELIKELNRNFRPYIHNFAKNEEQKKAIARGDKVIRCIFPDHEDKHPSMILNETSAFCFTCGTIDIFKAAEIFERKSISKKDFMKTAFYLAGKFDIDVSAISDISPETSAKLELYEFFEEMRNFIKMNVKSKITQKLLEMRGITTETALEYGVGYLDYKKFCNHLKSKMINYKKFEPQGFSEYNFTKTKLTIMFSDEEGRAVSFAVREMFYDEGTAKKILKNYISAEEVNSATRTGIKELAMKAVKEGMGEDEVDIILKSLDTAKYVNGNDSLIFKKKELLFGLDVVLKNKKVFTEVIAVEGYIDVMTAYKHGNKNVVAYCSGDLTPQQIKLLKRYEFSKIIWLPDNDKVGKKKIEKIVEKNKRENLDVEIGEFSVENKDEYKDLDEILNDREEEQIDIKLLINSLPIILKELEMLKTQGVEKKIILKELAKTLAGTVMPIDRELILQKLSDMVNKEEIRAIKEEAEFIIKIKKEGVIEKVNKENKTFMDKLKETPENFESLVTSFKENIKKEIGGTLGTKKTWKEQNLEKNTEIEERKKQNKDEKVFGTKALDDLKLVEAINIMIAGKPNTGKTQWMINTGIRMLEYDESSALLIISNDDTTFKLKTRILAILTGFSTSLVQNPIKSIMKLNANLAEKSLIQKKYNAANLKIENWMKQNRLMLLGSDIGVRTLEDVESVCVEHTNSLNGKEVNKMLLLDPASKLVVKDVDKPIAAISDFVKNRIVANYGYTTIQNYELTKVGFIRKRKTQYEDMAGGKELAYDGDVIFIVNNPLHDHGASAKSIWTDRYNNVNPVIALENSKDKVSDKKGRIYFYKLEGQKATIHEIDKEAEDYNQIKANFINDTALYTE